MVDFHKGDRDSPPTGLTQDAGSEPEDDWTPDKAVEAAGGQFAKLQQLAIEDGFDPFDPREEPPARKDLFGTYFPEGSHASFHMYSEMGSHPPGNGNVLFAFDPETGATSFDLEAHEEARAWWASVSIRLLCKAGDRVGRALGWEEWIDRELVPWAQEFAPLQEEALRRRQAVP